MKFLFLLIVSVIAIEARCSEITLVYPRSSEAGKIYTYSQRYDSTFVLGRIVPPEGNLLINGQNIVYSPAGAFLAWLPLRKQENERRWDLTLQSNGITLDSLSFPYAFDSLAAGNTCSSFVSPQAVCVTASNAHTRTTMGGGYHVFPDSGTIFLATGEDSAFYQIRLADGLSGAIEKRFVSPVSGIADLKPVIIGNGDCVGQGDATTLRLEISRTAAWTSEWLPDGRTLRILLLDAAARMDRIHYGESSFIDDITWEQLPYGVALQLKCRGPVSRGYAIWADANGLTVRIKHPYDRRKNRQLAGKTIVIDPGHGGTAAGAIGPLGTKEKDVALTWAGILAGELRRHGASVVLTRSDDRTLGLNERVDAARVQNADALISLHCNALPDGQNPLDLHGTETYYNQTGSRRLAEILHHHMLKATKLDNGGIWDASLAMVRPTDFPCVLLEAAYLIYPAEEELLRSESFLQRISREISRGLDEYFRSEP